MAQSAPDPADIAHIDALGDVPAAALAGVRLAVGDGHGGSGMLAAADGLRLLSRTPHLVCHAAFLANRLAVAAQAGEREARAARDVAHLDLAELFAFVHPARFALPSPEGMARALGIEGGHGGPADLLHAAAGALLDTLASGRVSNPRDLARLTVLLERARWPWAPFVRAALDRGGLALDDTMPATSLNVWDRLPDWEDDGPVPPPGTLPVNPDEAEAALATLIGEGAEARPAQRQYSAEAAEAFAPRDRPEENHILLAEAGTGLGKTLGYLAPATVWARRNGGTVWISTYTKNLQRQLRQEAQRAYPDPEERRRKVVIRKGRENYLCLLNLQERVAGLTPQNGRGTLLAALIARWAMASRDGDMVGGDFPAWLMPLFVDMGAGSERAPSPAALGLTDRRGECIHSACPHYRKCFIERAVRAARKAEIVIANHALVMIQAAMDHALGPPETAGEQTSTGLVRRLVFDEGHHVFDAADSAFSAHLTAIEAAELRRWLRGGEQRGRRGRSLAERIGDLTGDDEAAEEALAKVMDAARALPGPGWMRRIQAGAPDGPAERFLTLVREQVLARAEQRGPYAMEADCRPLAGGVGKAARELDDALRELLAPMRALARALSGQLDDEARTLETAERSRLEATARSLRRRGDLLVGGWSEMLTTLDDEEEEAAGFVSWFAIDHAFGRESDVGMHRHWIDPTIPLAQTVLETVDGAIVTSATLKDRPPDVPDDWTSAEMRTGATHLPYPVRRTAHDSPFDYPSQARILVVNDVNRQDLDQVAAAYRELFIASRGGALGLFTAISRLRQVHGRLLAPLGEHGLPLYAQHVDPIDNGTLVDIFRAEADACLLGTDAMRDGVDVPGEALRLIVLERVPWPQPSILDRARRGAFGGSAWQDMTVRLRLRQAFGRLVRKADDRGVFVVLDPRLPTRFTTAFPPGVAVERVGLVEAIEAVEGFLAAPLVDRAANG